MSSTTERRSVTIDPVPEVREIEAGVQTETYQLEDQDAPTDDEAPAVEILDAGDQGRQVAIPESPTSS